MTVLFDERALLHGPYFDAAGRLVPSVTTIIGNNLGWDSDVLHRWVARVTQEGYDHTALVRVAGEIGTCVHQMVERFLDPDLESLDPATWSPRVWEAASRAFESFIEWWNHYEVETLFTEMRLTHPTMGYGGTLDFGVRFAGHEALVDFKTSDAVRTAHVVQVAAYRELWRTQLDGDPRVYVLRLNVPGGPPHFQEVTGSMDLAFRVFEQLLGLERLRDEWLHGADERLVRLLG